jgi:hypothetical protein
MMGVYTGSSVDALTEAVFDDDIGLPPDPGYGSGVRFNATASTTYYIGVGGFSGATGNFTLKWGRCIPPQVFFASTKATVVKGPNVTVSFGARDGWDSSSLPNATWCDLDNTGWVACTSPYTNALPAGTHTLEIKAIENGVDSTDRASEAGGLLSTTFTIHSHKIKP